jgi:hypothetical protein
MTTINPFDAAQLALSIYAIQNPKSAKVFFRTNKAIVAEGNHGALDATVGSRLINTRDTFGVCVHGAGEFENDVFLVFRGSTLANFGADWVSNARIGLEIGLSGRPVHIGFNHIFTSMEPQLKNFFNSLNGAKPKTVHCIGHSLGGAIATLAADWVNHYHRAGETKVYTFGAPRPATHLFAKNLTDRLTKNNIYRVYHESDPVPMIPIFPFCHAPFGNMAYLIHTKPMFWPTDHKMGAYIKSVNAKGKSWQTLSPTGIHEPTDAQLKVWLESHIKVEPSSTNTWQWLGSALFFVLRKVIGFSLAQLQTAFIGAVTLADTLAAMLAKGLDDGDGPDGNHPLSGTARRERRRGQQSADNQSASYWIERLLRKIMQVLGWPMVEAKALTRSFMQRALRQLIEKSHFEALRAVQGLTA